MNTRLKMVYSGLHGWLHLLWDAIPPYRNVQGLVEAKEIDKEEHYSIVVGLDRISVDRTTFHALEVGENVHVLYTRSFRGIRIDRLLPDKDTV